MIQYLQSWFPGWGGWYGAQDPDKPEELLTSPSSWDILGARLCRGLVGRLVELLLIFAMVFSSSRDRRPVRPTGGLSHSQHVHQAGSPVRSAGVLAGEGWSHAVSSGQSRGHAA